VERVIEFVAGDGVRCNLINVRGAHEPAKGPVLLVHGAGPGDLDLDRPDLRQHGP
jgi:hypothetical protein